MTVKIKNDRGKTKKGKMKIITRAGKTREKRTLGLVNVYVQNRVKDVFKSTLGAFGLLYDDGNPRNCMSLLLSCDTSFALNPV